MADWQNFYLQKMGTDEQGQSYPIYESVGTWGVFCSEMPFVIFNKTKEPAKRSWYDEDGDDEYIPSSGLRMQAYTMKVKFGCKLISGVDSDTYGIEVENVRQNVGNFLNYLKNSGMMNVYSSYTGIGRGDVRLDSVNDDAKWVNDGNETWLIFNLVLKVNDPVTDVSLVEVAE